MIKLDVARGRRMTGNRIDGIAVDESKVVKCSFGEGNVAVGHFEMSAGCAALPDVKSQDLCLQHIVKADPIGTMEMTLIYNVELYNFLNRR